MVTITQKLHETIKQKKYNHQTLAALIGISPQSFSQRKLGQVPWELDEVFRVMDILNLPYCDIALYFKGRIKV